MKRFLLALLLLIAPAAFATDLVGRQGNDSIVLSGDKPCASAAVRKQVPAALVDQFRAATATLSGQMFQGCWINRGDTALVLYEDGDKGAIPLSMLKPATEI